MDELSQKEMRKLGSEKTGNHPGDAPFLYRNQPDDDKTIPSGVQHPSSKQDMGTSEKEMSQKELDRYLRLRLCSHIVSIQKCTLFLAIVAAVFLAVGILMGIGMAVSNLS